MYLQFRIKTLSFIKIRLWLERKYGHRTLNRLQKKMKETVYPQKSQQGMRPMILYLYFVFMGKSIDGFLHPSIVYISQRGGNIKVFFISVQPVVGSRLRFFYFSPSVSFPFRVQWIHAYIVCVHVYVIVYAYKIPYNIYLHIHNMYIYIHGYRL